MNDMTSSISALVQDLVSPPEGQPPKAQPTTAQGQLGYDRAVDALNRLPRPIMAFGTLALMIYGVLDPAGFELRMQGLASMPEPLWWLIGGILTFYFGAREAHYSRNTSEKAAPPPKAVDA